MTSSRQITYDITAKRGELLTYELPDLRPQQYILGHIEVKTTANCLDIRITGRDTILSISEAVLAMKREFDLTGYHNTIAESERLKLVVKNTANVSQKSEAVIQFSLILTYRSTPGLLVYHNVYTNLNQTGLSTILDDITKSNRVTNSIHFSSLGAGRLEWLRLTPQFKSELFTSFSFEPDSSGFIVISNPVEIAYLMTHMKYYDLTLSESVERLGVVIYGFPK